ncbi:unnamed protein product [Toxocara canis]|uniref:NPH3 domain-containing protein n=1 Tax=Toxocara canis TaxID=6265 RepID=A0A183VDQ2_TOXCA|nr:unnamed protein product [Toxocara canis]
MDNKLRVMQDLLDEINELNNRTPSTCTKSAEAHNISDDIIHKLLLIRKMFADPSTPASHGIMTTYALLNGDRMPNSPLASRKSSSLLTQAVLNDEENADPREVARSAYDTDNYAKCIRIIEKLLAKEGAQLDWLASQKITCNVNIYTLVPSFRRSFEISTTLQYHSW